MKSDAGGVVVTRRVDYRLQRIAEAVSRRVAGWRAAWRV
jgi:hypothetical protein